MLVTLVAGARPNFIKIAPIINAIRIYNATAPLGQFMRYRLVHTGQHFDQNMSGDFFDQLGIPDPDVNLCARGTSQAELTAEIMIKFERELLNYRPDVVLVVGDVTSTMACAITAKKLCIPVVHVEGGIRSGDLSMPEEINRIVTDAISDHFFTTSVFANDILMANGINRDQIHFVGNTMIDTLLQNLGKLRQPKIWQDQMLNEKEYIILTLHRPCNVDNLAKLKGILDSILLSTSNTPVVFPVHPRTRKQLDRLDYQSGSLLQVTPQPYLDFMYLLKHCKAIVTDSGGISEESTVLGIPCITLRNSTERPETVITGTNVLAGDNPECIASLLKQVMQGEWPIGSIPEFWDGNTSKRIVETLSNLYSLGPQSIKKSLFPA